MNQIAEIELDTTPELTTFTTDISEDAIRCFWACMYAPGDIVEFRLVKPSCIKGEPPEIRQHWYTSGSDVPFPDLHASNQLGFNVYAGINPRKHLGGSKAGDVQLCRALAVDLDGVTFDEWVFKAHEWDLPGPTMIIHSGGGLWLVWRLEESPGPARWTQYQRALIQECRKYELNADKTIHDAPRVMRVPGFVNCKYDHEPIATILSADPCRQYSLNEFPIDLKPLPATKNSTVFEFTSGPCKTDHVEVDSPKPTDLDWAKMLLNNLAQFRCDETEWWLQIGMILHWCNPTKKGFGVWDEWSLRRSPKYASRGGDLARWQSFSANGNGNGQLTIGTLEHWAQEDMLADVTIKDISSTSASADHGVSLAHSDFPIEALPSVMAEMVTSAADVLGVDSSAVAVPMLAVFAGAVGNSRHVRISEDWAEPAHIWTALIADSGTKKTSVLKLVSEPLTLKQREASQEYKAAKTTWKIKLLMAAKGADKANAMLEEPKLTKYKVDDITIESIADFLSENPRSGILLRDELSGWIASFGQYKSQSKAADAERAKWLSLYSPTDLQVDRKGGEHTLIPDACLSICGIIQPAIWDACMKQSAIDTGFDARFLTARTRDKVAFLSAKSIPKAVKLEYHARMHRLLALAGNVPLTLSSEAYQAFKVFHDECESLRVTTTSKRRKNWLAKLKGATARLSLILTLADNPDELVIGVEAMNRAIKLAKWFCEQAAHNDDGAARNAVVENAAKIMSSPKLMDLLLTNGCITKKDVYTYVRGLRLEGRKLSQVSLEALEYLTSEGTLQHLNGKWTLPANAE